MRYPSVPRRLFPNVNTVAHVLSEQYSDYAHGNKANPLNELLFIICSLQTNEDLYLSTYASLREVSINVSSSGFVRG